MSFPAHPPKLHTNIEIPIECRILTSQTAGAMVAAIIDLLLFERQLIPMVYPTFKMMVDRLPVKADEADQTGGGGLADWANYLVDAERASAQKTLANIKALKHSIADRIAAAQPHVVDRVLIVFGPHGLMATEAYDIHLPAVNRRHFGANHPDHLQAVRALNRQMAFLLNQLDEAADAAGAPAPNRRRKGGQNGGQQQVFAMVHSSGSGAAAAAATGASGGFIVHHNYELHPDCRLTTFRLVNRTPENGCGEDDLNCCGSLVVFGAEDRVSSTSSTGGEEEVKSLGDNAVWLESPVSVSGYRDKPVNGKPIWL